MEVYKKKLVINLICPGILIWAFCVTATAQDNIRFAFWQKLKGIENTSTTGFKEKLSGMQYLKKSYEKVGNKKDSVYARILDRIALYDYFIHDNIPTVLTFEYAKASAQINIQNNKYCAVAYAINTYNSIGFYYKNIGNNTLALKYFDSSIIYSILFNVLPKRRIESRMYNAKILADKGDYSKALEISKIGLKEAKSENYSIYIRSFSIEIAYLNIYEENYKAVFLNADSAFIDAQKANDNDGMADAIQIKSLAYSALDNYKSAMSAFETGISIRLKGNNIASLCDDYINYGNYFTIKKNDYKRAIQCYLNTLKYALQINNLEKMAKANLNIGFCFYNLGDYENAHLFYTKALNNLKINCPDILSNLRSLDLFNVGNYDILFNIMENKTNLLLKLYEKKQDTKYLDACIQSAILTDSVITKTRHEQVGEKSKLYWRNTTRDFYNKALKACYAANNPKLAFYFMEKSRAVLLNDRLNELGASVNLPPSEANAEEAFRIDLIQKEQELSNLKEGTTDYKAQELKLIQSESEIEHYIQSLEQKFPVYFRYKYNDKVPDLKDLQQYLAKNNQAFVHYFITDSVVYVLGITPNTTKLIKVSSNVFSTTQLADFIKMCADKQVLNAHYDEYIHLSNSIYTALFQPLQIQQKHLVICADNFLIPFNALCTDKMGKHFLIQDYAFSYAYSARSLLSPSNNYSSKGIFFGVAPVSFAANLQMPELKESAKAVTIAASTFKSKKLLLNKEATRNAFMKLLPQYRIVNVFSHANADSSDEEPSLFMADSVIHLSELQTITKPATQLVVLSACQTNVGKLATGEGIYSLARGFASVGIPSVAATLWSADEDAIYEITQLFDHNLVQGMRKDDALQQAELTFMQHGGEKLYPYYWANMVLVGDAGLVKLSNPTHWEWLLSIAGTLLIIATFIIIKRRKSNSKKINIYSSL